MMLLVKVYLNACFLCRVLYDHLGRNHVVTFNISITIIINTKCIFLFPGIICRIKCNFAYVQLFIRGQQPCKEDDVHVEDMMRTWTEEWGYPMVTVSVNYDTGVLLLHVPVYFNYVPVILI